MSRFGVSFAFLLVFSVVFKVFCFFGFFNKRHTSKQTICLKKGAGKGERGRERKIREKKIG